jgi:hypothetical protein
MQFAWHFTRAELLLSKSLKDFNGRKARAAGLKGKWGESFIPIGNSLPPLNRRQEKGD